MRRWSAILFRQVQVYVAFIDPDQTTRLSLKIPEILRHLGPWRRVVQHPPLSVTVINPTTIHRHNPPLAPL